MFTRRIPVIAGIMWLALAGASWGCGAQTDCIVAAGTYRIAMADRAKATLVFAHGYRGQAARAIRSKPLREVVEDHGVNVVTLQAAGDDWSIPNAPSNANTKARDEAGYLRAVLDDLEARHGIMRTDVVLSGFSAGGMLVWQMACDADLGIRGFLPMGGTFWAPNPTSCAASPMPLVHIHGTKDTVVPLEGRPIADTHQGNVRDAIRLYGESGGFVPEGAYASDNLDCDVRRNEAGAVLAFCLHPRGHVYSSKFVAAGLRLIDGDR